MRGTTNEFSGGSLSGEQEPRHYRCDAGYNRDMVHPLRDVLENRSVVRGQKHDVSVQ